MAPASTCTCRWSRTTPERLRVTSMQPTPSLLFLAAAACLAGCGGDTRASIGGNVSGLNAGQSVTLQDNHADTLAVSANGPFRFGTELDGGTSYSVTILTQPS